VPDVEGELDKLLQELGASKRHIIEADSALRLYYYYRREHWLLQQGGKNLFIARATVGAALAKLEAFSADVEEKEEEEDGHAVRTAELGGR
jgi:hypothetical protein